MTKLFWYYARVNLSPCFFFRWKHHLCPGHKFALEHIAIYKKRVSRNYGYYSNRLKVILDPFSVSPLVHLISFTANHSDFFHRRGLPLLQDQQSVEKPQQGPTFSNGAGVRALGCNQITSNTSVILLSKKLINQCCLSQTWWTVKLAE